MLKRGSNLKKLSCLALLTGLILFGCKGPEPQDLPFETVTSDLGGLGYMQEDPNLLIITGPEEVDTPGLDVQFPADLAEQLRAVDYQRNFVVVVFRGLLGARSASWTAEVRQVTRYGAKVILIAHFEEPGPGVRRTYVPSSPYQVVTISKEGEWARLIRFVLEANGEEVKECNHFVP